MARILILGAGFGGLELSTKLSETLGDDAEVTVIDKGWGFVFGYSKLDLMFHGRSVEEVRLPYGEFVKPGVRLLRETVIAIDPEAKRVTTDAGVHEADYLVIALGADYDLDATPGLRELDSEFYSVAGAEKLATKIPTFTSGRALIGVCGAPFKCPPAPSECSLLLDDELRRRGVRDACEITFVIPLPAPVPPSPETSAALRVEFEKRGIELITGKRIASVDAARQLAVLDEGTELSFDLFLGVPKHRAPTSSSSPASPRTVTCRSTRRRSQPRSRASTRSATSPRPASRRRASSPRARQRSSRSTCSPGSPAATIRSATSAKAPATSSSARAGSAASTSTSSPAPSAPASSTRLRASRWR
jgi:NADPH-dependent 2,4-dienoyl-CoA reductase/sulfur reductase-like enzyme